MSSLDSIQRWGVPLLLLINALWMLVIPSFPTLDGWPHLHTARMLMDGSYGDVYCANTGMVPNRVGHLLLGVLQLIFPALVSERILLALIIWLMGWGTWRLARVFGGGQLLVLLVLPFTWNFLLVMGFHNFLLGVGLALVGAAWWVNSRRLTMLHLLGLAGWTLLLFNTHTMALVLFLLVTGLHEAWVLAQQQERQHPLLRGHRLHGSLGYALACLPAIVLLIIFQAEQRSVWPEAEPATALGELKDLRILLLYSGWDEGKFGYAMKLVLVSAAVVAVVGRVLAGGSWRLRITHRDMLLGAAFVVVVLLVVLPDSTGLASYISLRLQLMVMLLVITWLAAQPVPLAASLAPAIILLMVHQARLRYVQETNGPTADLLEKVLDAARHIPEGATVLPISNVSDWTLGHISSLLAAERKVTLLDNYECSNNYFPLQWCPDMPLPLLEHMGGQDRCLQWLEPHLDAGAWPVMDHLVIIGGPVPEARCDAQVLGRIMEQRSRMIYNNGYVKVLQLH